jgi:hypothetical protein
MFRKSKKCNLLVIRIVLLFPANGKVGMSLQLTSFWLKKLSGYVDPSCKTL